MSFQEVLSLPDLGRQHPEAWLIQEASHGNQVYNSPNWHKAFKRTMHIFTQKFNLQLVCILFVSVFLSFDKSLHGEDSAWLPIIELGGVQRVKVDANGELQSFVVVGVATINRQLEPLAGRRDAQIRATLDAKRSLVRWLGESVVSIEESKSETKVIVDANGKERGESTTDNVTIYQAFAEVVVSGTRPLYILERPAGNESEYCLVLGWSKKEAQNSKSAKPVFSHQGELPWLEAFQGDFDEETVHPIQNNRFSNIRIQPGYLDCLLADEPVMELGGARVYALPDGRRYLISVGSTVVKPDSPKELLRRERVAMAKAKANLQKLSGVKVTSIVNHSGHARIVEDSDGGVRHESIEELFDCTHEKVHGLVARLPRVGEWYSRDGTVYYVAIGVVLSQ